ncbi:MAG: sulfate adenylyltransferase subunit CysD [Candidatus Omnitrophica bacterium]|nr:sulfate adenylyltransferase subunit CysD [Candidatus Omnitrophota bacterium]MDD5553351.1 sulfate adenylyltransferase subunit CysD [Candidatus Omnitrophota bacterium]
MKGLSYLDGLESKSIYIIREAFWEHKGHLAILWSMGKDSTTLVHLARKAFLGQAFAPVIHIDTTFKFKEIYEFRGKLTKEWGLDLIIARNDAAINEGMSPKHGRFDCCNALKTEALKQAIKKHGLKALLVGIRRDEHSIRAKERYFSSRDKEFNWDYKNQPLELWGEYHKTITEADDHMRIHPLLHWQEIDIWRYVKKERLPVVDLYFAKKNKRYRSIGCACCCQPIQSKANSIDKIIKEIESTKISERSGRAQDKEKEYMMQKLRSLGYM